SAVRAKHSKLQWTGTLVDLVELLTSLQLASCFNHGKATMKQIVRWAESEFGVNLEGYHITFNEAARRKIDRTKFLNRLMTVLINKMDSML
ncbi:hypothetical protein GP486_008795, partial [Trichoglossum hirsutum]